ncbi:MAG: hypothetical protein IIX85_07975 [Clostridia bacterium]|nr:hypothetical protein [Clostridia bacterium]
MFASLRFPDGKSYNEIYLPPEEFGLEALLDEVDLTPLQRDTILKYLPLSCDDPDVLSYRAELATEVFTSGELQRIFSQFAALGEASFPIKHPHNSTAETDCVRTVTLFEEFSARFEHFRTELEGVVPKSAAAVRFFRFCRNYAESFEYKELKSRAADLRRDFGFERGYLISLGNPKDQAPTVKLRTCNEAEGISDTVRRVMEEFGVVRPPVKNDKNRLCSDAEVAVLTGIIRKDPRLHHRLQEFTELYEASGSGDLIRLCEEAVYYNAVNRLYLRWHEQGYTVCRPVFRNAGFYSEIFGLNYKTETDKIGKEDFITSPLNHITVVFGPDAGAYLDAVKTAHFFASSGGLICAEGAEIAPIDRLERDKQESLHTEGLTEHSLCLCGYMFDAMLPRQEDAAAAEVIDTLSKTCTRSVVRICCKSNLTALQKRMDGGTLPPCTLLQVGTDYTLEELLQRHKLTAKHLEEDEK